MLSFNCFFSSPHFSGKKKQKCSQIFKKRQLFRENKFQIWPSTNFRVVFWIASKKLGLISSASSAFWPKCISTHWLETWIEIYCLNFNNFCSNWEGRGAVWTNPPPTGEVKTMEFRGGGFSYQQVRNIFLENFFHFLLNYTFC